MKHLTWKWYKYGPNEKYDCWEVINLATNSRVLTSTESACIKIIELAHALKTGQPKPLNHKTLESKAKFLEQIPFEAQRYWKWNGETLKYDTKAYE